MPDRRGGRCRVLRLGVRHPEAARALKAQVVANQLDRLGDFAWDGEAEPLGDGAARGWRTRVRLDVDADGRPGFHRYHSDELVTDLRCAQLPDGMLDGLDGSRLAVRRPSARGRRRRRQPARGAHQPSAAPWHRAEGDHYAVQRVGRREWRIPVTAFWQSHRDAAAVYSELVADWARAGAGMTAWDLYGGAGVFAAVLADVVGDAAGC